MDLKILEFMVYEIILSCICLCKQIDYTYGIIDHKSDMLTYQWTLRRTYELTNGLIRQ